MPKMLFTQTVRYPLYETLYAQEGDKKDVPVELVDRMIKRGALLLEEKEEKAEEKNSKKDEPKQDEPKQENSEGKSPELDSAPESDLDADANLLDAETPELKEEKKEESSDKNKNKNKNKDK